MLLQNDLLIRATGWAKVFAIVATLGASGCSPSSLFGSGTDPEVLDTRTYRKVNTACASVDMSSGRVSPEVFRALVSCLNAYGALEPIEALVKGMTDSEIQSLVDLGNRSVFDSPARLYEMEQTIATLKRKGLLAPLFSEAGKLLEDPEAALSLIAAAERSSSSASLWLRLETPEKTARALDVGLTVLRSRVFQSLALKLEGSELAGLSIQAWRAPHREHESHLNVLERVLEGMASGELTGIFKNITGSGSASVADPTAILEQSAGLAKLFSELSARGGESYQGVTRLFHSLNVPIQCVRGGASLPNANVVAMKELAASPIEDVASFVQYGYHIKLMVVGSLCDFPQGTSTYYPYLVRLADTPAIQPTARIIREFVRAGKTELLADLLSELGSSDLGAAGLPVIAELASRDAWGDLSLFFSLLNSEDEASLAWLGTQALRDLSLKAGEIEALARATAKAAPLLELLRKSLHSNDRHPFLDVLNELQRGEGEGRASQVIFQIAAKPEFREAVSLLGVMGQDGRLQEIVETVVALFHKRARAGATEIRETAVPVHASRAVHDFSASDLPVYRPRARIGGVEAAPACRRLDLSGGLADFPGGRSREQWELALSCVNSDKLHSDSVEALEFLLEEKAPADGRSYFEHIVGILRSNPLGKDEIRYVVDQLVKSYDSGTLSRWMNAIPLWIGHAESEATQVLRPAIELLASVWLEGAKEIRSVESYLASVLKQPDFADLARELERMARAGGRLFDASRAPVEGPFDASGMADLARIKRWVRNLECETQRDPTARAEQVIREYRDAITNWDLVDGSPRESFTAAEMRGHLRDLLSRISDEKVSAGLLNVLDHFKREGAREGRSAGEYLVRWFQDRAQDWQPIAFFYPGEDRPRVKLVNTIDRLELILINVDFMAPGIPPQNNGLKFMGELAEAWGDEPREAWPKEIQRKFPLRSKKRPATIAEWAEDVKAALGRYERLVGFPEKPSCAQTGPKEDLASWDSGGISFPNWTPGIDIEMLKRTLFNNRQIIDVLDRNIPGARHAHAGGLRFLRNLFFELHNATPEKFRNGRAGEANQLSLIPRVVRMGLARQLGQQGWTFSHADPKLIGHADELIEAAGSKPIRKLLPTLGKPGIELLNLSERIDPKLINELRERVARLQESSEYQALDLELSGEDWLGIFSDSAISRKLRLQLADLLESGELDHFADLASRKPDDFYRVLLALSQSLSKQELQNFIGIVRRSLSEN